MRITAWLAVLFALSASVANVDASTFFFLNTTGDDDFFNELNWNDAADGTGANPAADTINPSGGGDMFDITLDLVIDGQTATAADDVDFGEGGSGSLTLINNAQLNVTGSANDLDFDSDATFTLVNSTVDVADNIFIGGTLDLTGGSIESGDDIEFQASASLTIDGSSFSADDNFFFNGFSPTNSVVGATFLPADRFGLNTSGGNVVLTDATVTINNGDDDGDIEDVSGSLDGNEAGILTLLGASVLTADDLREGADLVLGGSSTAVLGVLSVADGDSASDPTYVGGTGEAGEGASVTLISLAALLTVPDLDIVDGIDPTEFIFNGLGAESVSLSENPAAFLVTPLAGGGFTIQAVPEPHAAALLLIGFAAAGFGARRKTA